MPSCRASHSLWRVESACVYLSRLSPKYLDGTPACSKPSEAQCSLWCPQTSQPVLSTGTNFGWEFAWTKGRKKQKQKTAKHATCCLFLPQPGECVFRLGVMSSDVRADGGRRRGAGLSFVFSLNKCVARDSRNRRGRVCVCVCMWVCEYDGDSLLATVCCRVGGRVRRSSPAWAALSALSDAAGRPRSPRRAKRTPPPSRWHFRYAAGASSHGSPACAHQ